MANVLLTFSSDSKRNDFVESIMDSLSEDINLETDVETAVKSMVKFYSLFIAGQFILEGTAEEVNDRFIMEVANHKANIEIREKLENDEWKVVRHRRNQR